MSKDAGTVSPSIITASEHLQSMGDITVLISPVTDLCPLHSHEFVEIAYIASGKGMHTIESEQKEVVGGDLFLIGENVSHSFTAFTDSPLQVYNCIFLPPTVEEAFDGESGFVDVAYRYLYQSIRGQDNQREYIKLSNVSFHGIGHIMEEMYREYEAKQDGFRQVIRSDLIRLLIQIFRLHREDPEQRSHISLYRKLIANNAMEYLSRHYADSIQCDDMAARAYLSPTYFSRIFKKETGKTIIEALQDIRIEKACALLNSTALSVAEIASQVGYDDMKHFYKLFERKHSLTPGQYRARG